MALVLLVGGALGVGAYVLVSGADINLPDLNLDTGTDATTISNTTLEDTTINQATPETTVKEPPPQAPKVLVPGIQDIQLLNRCIDGANGDIDKITACFDRFNASQR